MRIPTSAERSAISAESAKGSDAALPVSDRRSRARISPATDVAAGASVYVGQDRYVMLGPGRGEGWARVAWVEDDGTRCYGTLHESQFATSRPPGQKSILLIGQSNAVRCVVPDLSAYGVTVIKCARDSSSITRWLPGGSERAALYEAVDGTDVQEAWVILGEEDARLVDLAEAFGPRLPELANDLRTTLNKPNLRLRIALVNSALERPYAAMVRSAEANFCATDPNAESFDMDTVPGYDGLHYSATGNVASGAGLGNGYIATQQRMVSRGLRQST